MKRILACVLLVMLLGASTSCSTDPGTRQDALTGSNRSASLDALFNRLQTTDDDDEAHLIEVTIRHVWAQSGRQGVDTLMKRAADATHAGRLDDALEAANQIVSAAPDFAEGWNLRATIHYLRDEYGEAVTDIEHVLAIEPRHFGALAGLGRILLELEDKKAALRAFEAALAVNPHMTEVRNQTNDLREQLAGIPI
ncbi:MAG TPA: tetratricopeptide repeat protein [Magnetospirillum sp.]|jgi:Flp pilus assembly protein TadD|nr:tetratricopeptide repeat protein [Magnetospirillum sp.]